VRGIVVVSELDPPRNPARLSPGSHHQGVAALWVLSAVSNSCGGWPPPLRFGYDSPPRAQEARVRAILWRSPGQDRSELLPRASGVRCQAPARAHAWVDP
jgi:hypothetical protein